MARMNDRGQILLIGAITIAVTFLALAIVLNGSLHTPSIAAEASDDVTGTELEEVRDATRQEATEIVQYANNEYSTLNDPEAYVEDNVERLGNRLGVYYARQDAVVTVGATSSIEAPPGERIASSITAASTTAIDEPDTELRHFNVDPDGISTGSVTIEIDDGTTHTIDVTSSNVIVDGSACGDHNGQPIEVTNATMEATGHCAHLEFVSDLSESYDVRIYSGGSFSGSVDYRFIGKGTGFSGGTPRVYGVEIPLEYRSPTVTFDGTLVVAPGEP